MEAAIFDLDGTLIDLFEVHYEAFHETVKKYTGLEFTREDLVAGYGLKTEGILKIFLKKHDVSNVDLQALSQERKELVLKNLSKVKVLAGVVKLLEELKSARVKLAVGTSGRGEVTLKVLEEAGLIRFFKVVSSIDDVNLGKPAPDIFLNAAKKMGVQPEDCVVFEDSPFGIQAAKEARMKVVAVLYDSHHKRNELEKEKPDLIVESLKDINIAKLKNLF